MPSTDDDDLIERAIKAHCRTPEAPQPARDACEVLDVKGRKFVVLANVSGSLSSYRVRGDGRLERLPADLADELFPDG